MSPAQRLFNRRTKIIMPTTMNSLQPRIDNGTAMHKQDKKRATAVQRINQQRRDLRPLLTGETVRLQPIQRDQKE